MKTILAVGKWEAGEPAPTLTVAQQVPEEGKRVALVELTETEELAALRELLIEQGAFTDALPDFDNYWHQYAKYPDRYCDEPGYEESLFPFSF